MHGTVPPLHALTNDVVLADPGFVPAATAVMKACRSRIAIHLRAAEITAHRMLELALELRVIAEVTGSWVLINDRVDIAMVSGVTGAQLTSRSLAIADARRIAPQMVLGASVHATADAWLTAQSGATFLVAGAARGDVAQQPPTRTAVRPAISWRRAEGCPVVAVGGITPESGASASCSAGASRHRRDARDLARRCPRAPDPALSCRL
ncbi:MAG: thiamine phosphate synthase [Gemmatimonadaceae bacterium]|nr:thiamine phosphate synthase [Gemmatimonadaceae bacterium]